MEKSDSNEKDFNLSILDIFVFIFKYLKLLIIIPVITFVIISVLLYLSTKLPYDSPYNFFPGYYQPEVEVLITNSSSNDMTAAISQASSIPGLGNFLGGNSNSNFELAKIFIEGKTLADQITKEFDFAAKYGLTDHVKTASRETFKYYLEVENSDSEGGIIISYKDENPQFAAEVVNRLVELLEERFQDFSQNKIKGKRKFLEERIEQINEELKVAQGELIQFQNTYGITDINVQSRFYTEQIFSLKSQIIGSELEKQKLLEYTSADDPRVIQLDNLINIYRKLIDELTTGFNKFSIQDIPQNQLQQLTNQFYDIKRELEIQETLYTFLKQQYESIKIEEADTTKTLQVIEWAEIPELRAGPNRTLITVIAIGLAVFLSIFIAFILEFIDQSKKNPTENEKINQIKGYLTLKIFQKKKKTETQKSNPQK